MSGARHGWIAVVSGKGGVGKTNVVANLAIAAAGLGARPLVVDGDLGLANVDVLLGLAPPRSVGDALAGRCGIADTLVDAPRGVRLLPAASARPDLATPGHGVLARLLALIHEVAAPHDLVLIDAGAGVGPAVTGLAAACDRVLAVTTPEPTSLADAYATFKVLRQNPLGPPVELIVNAASSAREARRTHDCLDVLARRFLGEGVRYRGWLPADPLLREAVARQRAAVEAFPTSRWARAVTALAESILSDPQVGALAPADRIPSRESGESAVGVPAAGRR